MFQSKTSLFEKKIHSEKLPDIDLFVTSYKADGLLFVGAWSLPTQTEVNSYFRSDLIALHCWMIRVLTVLLYLLGCDRRSDVIEYGHILMWWKKR